MEERKPFALKVWMLIALVVGILLLVFNYDPVGDALEKSFGQGADQWVINIVLIVVIVYLFIKKK